MTPPSRLKPQRLADGDDAYAHLIRQSDIAPTPNHEVVAWEALEQRLHFRRRMLQGVQLSLAAGVALAAFLAIDAASTVTPTPAEPERLAQQEYRAEATLRDESPPHSRGSEREVPAGRRSREEPPLLRKRVARANAPISVKKTEATAPVPANTKQCRSLARSGKPAAAESCYLTVGAGQSLQSQIALYELARLRRGALGNAAGAIHALRQYRRRFPSGSFRSEAQLALIELLASTGRTVEAEREAKTALLAGVAPERAGDLHLLIANQRASNGDCAAAMTRLEQAALAGAQAERITALRRRCEGRESRAVELSAAHSAPPKGVSSTE